MIGIDPCGALLPSDGTESYEMPPSDMPSGKEFSRETDEVLFSTNVEEESSTEMEEESSTDSPALRRLRQASGGSR